MQDISNFLTRSLVAITLLVPFTAPAAAYAQDSSSQTNGDQTGGNARALDSLGTAHTGHKAPQKTTTHPHHAAHHARAANTQAHMTASAQSQSLAAAAPPIPAAPPPPPVIKAPLIDVPLHPEPPPPPVPVVAAAVGDATPIANGTRVSFGAGTADMNQATIQAVQAIAAQMKADPTTRAQIDAYAPGAADDPSSPRRTALERGLAARAVLINAGIPSTRIYVRAIGQPHDGGPVDRLDLIRSDSTQQQTSTAQ